MVISSTALIGQVTKMGDDSVPSALAGAALWERVYKALIKLS